MSTQSLTFRSRQTCLYSIENSQCHCCNDLACREGNQAPATEKPKTRPRTGFFVPTNGSLDARIARKSRRSDGRVMNDR
jgi:hypothetical protein